jgi:hypothetical protein
MYGRILPETRYRVFDEEMTFIAEGINRPLTTEFVLQEFEGQLVYFDRGEWRPYIGTLIKGLEVANLEVNQDPRKKFLADRAAEDLRNGYAFMRLKPGESMAWYSPYPEQEEKQYGARFINEQGFQPRRKMGFLYHAQKLESGELVLTSQSVDGSDEDAFQEALKNTENITTMRNAYDAAMSYKYHARFYAGRRQGENLEENVWSTMQKHKDLFEYYFGELEQLAYASSLSRKELEVAKQKLTYGVWAALKERLNKNVFVSHETSRQNPGTAMDSLRHEVEAAYQIVSARGEVLLGCGGSIEGEQSILDLSPQAMLNLIFGNTAQGNETWTWKSGICRVDGCPTRPGFTKVGPCQVCLGCQHMFDNGKNPVNIYKHRKAKAQV